MATDYASPYQLSLPADSWVDGSYTLAAQAYMRDGFVTTAATIQINFANGITEPPVNTNAFTPSAGTAPAPGQPFVVVATGDGADGASNASAVTALIASMDPNLVLYLGDVYEKGTFTEFENWYGDGSTDYGQFRSITNPTIGNHEYENGEAPGYFNYWDNPPDYYSFDVAGWHFISLNSTSQFGETDPGSAQYQWLAQDLAANPSACKVAYFHHPVISAGPQGDTGSLQDIWALFQANDVDLVLAGHDHQYQRFVPLDTQLNPDPNGITEFVVGTGGHGIQSLVRNDNRLAAWSDTVQESFGALRLELNTAGLSFAFVNVYGQTVDNGTIACSASGPDQEPPSAPANLTTASIEWNKVSLDWTAATDNVGVAGYDIYRNGSLLQSAVPTATFDDANVIPETAYDYYVVARDAAGNISSPSNQIQVTTPPFDPVLFSDGFESGDLSNWSTPVGVAVQSAHVYEGVFAAQATANGSAAWTWRALEAPEDEVYYKLRFKILSQASTFYLMKFRTETGSSLLGVSVTSAGILNYRNDVIGASVNSTTMVSLQQWHEVQARLRINNGAGEIEIWFDGQRVDDLSNSASLGTVPIGRVQFGDNSPSRIFDTIFDDVAVSLESNLAPDTEWPSAPSNLVTTAEQSDLVSLSWTVSTDNIGVSAYDIYRDGGLLASVSGAETTYDDGSVAAETSYQYQVFARDAAGNTSAGSNLLDVTTPGGPVVLSFSPMDDTTIIESLPNDNYGSLTLLRLDSPAQDILLKFDATSTLGGTVVSAKLRLYNTNPSSSGGNFFTTGSVWSEGSVTWNTAPLPVTPVGSLGSVSSGNWYELDVTSAVVGDADGIISLRTANFPTTNGADYSSKENPDGNGPQLIVTLQ